MSTHEDRHTPSAFDHPGDPMLVVETVLQAGHVTNDADAQLSFVVGEDTVDVEVVDIDVRNSWRASFTIESIASLCNWYLLQFPGMRHVPSATKPTVSDSPVVVCLCGSTRFYEAFQRANYEETMAGRIVLSVGFVPQAETQGSGDHGEAVGCTPEQKMALDELHKRKIQLADEILVLNVTGYIGDSTRSEVQYAEQLGKRIRWLEHPDNGIGLWAQLGPGETFTRLDDVEIEIGTDPEVMLDEWHASDSRVEAHTFMGWTDEEYGHWVTDPDAHPDADPGPGPNGPSRAPAFDPDPGMYPAEYKLTKGWHAARFAETAPGRFENVYFDPESDHVAWRSGGKTRHRPISDVVWWGGSVGPDGITDATIALLDEGDDETTYAPGVDPEDTAVLDIPDEPIGPEPTNPKPFDEDIPF